jgi:hypothetical protein
MECAVLFSGGKDSTLAALLLESVYDVTLVTGQFGITDVAGHAREAADAIDFPMATVDLDREVAAAAVEQMVADGYPREGIQQVHEHALEVVAGLDYDAIADGTRRDDRVPTVTRPAAQSLEDRHGVDYLAPLAGFGRGAIDDLVAQLLVVEAGPSDAIAKADYETELRALIADRYGADRVADIFPAHTQTRVRGLR